MVQTDVVFSGVGGGGQQDGAPTKTHQAIIVRENKREKAQEKAKEKAVAAKKAAPATPTAPLTAAERTLLSLLASLSAPILAHPTFAPLLQSLKAALFAKDYATAFGIGAPPEDRVKVELMHEVYAARWVPSRALVYRRLLEEFGIKRLLKGGGKAVVLGGGAGSELLALGSLVGTEEIEVHVVDSADWSAVLDKQKAALTTLTTTPPPSPTLSLHFHQGNLLSLPSTVPTLPLAAARLLTLFFTLSELFLQSRAQTLHFLHHLTVSSTRGTVLIVLESASLGVLQLGKDARTYPLGMMLDHALEMGGKWDVVESEDSRWCRMPAGVEDVFTGVKLESMRVLLRVYRRN